MAFVKSFTIKGAAGQDGATILFGTDAPGAQLGKTNDVYIRLVTFDVYYKTSSGWQLQGTTKGTDGVVGKDGATWTFGASDPGPNYGAVGDFYYNKTTYTIFSKTSTGWTSLGSVLGAKGDQGVQGVAGTAGANAPGIRYGNGAPTTANPTIQMDGDYYIDNVAKTIQGPRVNGVWTGTVPVPFGGTITRSGTGAPDNAIGNVGDLYLDLNGFLYPPKTAQGWTIAPISLIGPQGLQGPLALGGSQAGIGPVASASGFAVTTTPQPVPIANSTMPCTFFPATASALLNVQVVNNSGPALTLQLYNVTTSTVVISGLSFGAGTTLNSPIYTPTQYPLVANNEYQWRVSAAAAGTSTFGIYPTYLMPSATASVGVTHTGSAGFSTSTTLTSGGVMLPFLGNPIANGWNFKPFRSGYFYDIVATFYPTGTSTATTQGTLRLMSYNTSSQAVVTLATYTITANSKPQRMGPFAANAMPTVGASNIQYYYNAFGANVTGTLVVETQVVL